MLDNKGSLQWEGSADSNLSAGQFLREIDNKIDECSYTTEKQKVNCLHNNIAFGSATDEWFNKLTIGVVWVGRTLTVWMMSIYEQGSIYGHFRIPIQIPIQTSVAGPCTPSP